MHEKCQRATVIYSVIELLMRKGELNNKRPEYLTGRVPGIKVSIMIPH